jgi:hypothetical protein
MLVSWTATDPDSRRFSATERRSDNADLSDRFSALRSHGQGYLEIRLPDGEFPLLVLGPRDDQAVIHLFHADGRGDCVLAVDRAWVLVRSFVQKGAPDELGEWRGL